MRLGYGSKLSMKKHTLPRQDRDRASVYAEITARNAKFMREREQRKAVRRAAYEALLERSGC